MNYKAERSVVARKGKLIHGTSAWDQEQVAPDLRCRGGEFHALPWMSPAVILTKLVNYVV